MPDIFEQQEREFLRLQIEVEQLRAVVEAARALLDGDGELKPWGLLEDALAALDATKGEHEYH